MSKLQINRMVQLTPAQHVHFLQKLADMAAQTADTLQKQSRSFDADLDMYLRVQQRAFEHRFFRLGK